MDKKWNKRKRPELADMLTIREQSSQLQDFVVGQLLLESLVVQLIDLGMKDAGAFDAFRLSFPQKVELGVGLGLLSDRFAGFLKGLNALRNRFAHRLGHTLSFDEVFALAGEAARAGVEFTDDIDKNLTLAKEAHDGDLLIKTILDNTAHELALLIDEAGGEYCFA